jgi:myo-inositol-1(or 4)-monophosphatase
MTLEGQTMPHAPRPVDVAVRAAREAGTLLVRYFRSFDPSWVEEKSRNDVVSRADRESEALLREILLGAFPGDRFVGEEGGDSGPAADGEENAPSWIVDPLDGTANFVRGFPHWAVSIARTEGGPQGRLDTAVIWDPLKGDLFTSVRGEGAFRNGRRLDALRHPGLSGSALATGFPFRQQSKIDVYLKVFRAAFLEVRSLRRAGSAALDLAYVAAGIFDGFFEFGLSPWDTAAGALLVTEAGGVVSDFDGGPAWRSRGNLVAAAPGVHAEFLGLVRATGVSEENL